MYKIRVYSSARGQFFVFRVNYGDFRNADGDSIFVEIQTNTSGWQHCHSDAQIMDKISWKSTSIMYIFQYQEHVCL